MTKEHGRRLKVLYVPYMDLIGMIRSRKITPRHINLEVYDIPEDHTIVDVDKCLRRNSFAFVIHSSEFEPVPPTMEIPSIEYKIVGITLERNR